MRLVSFGAPRHEKPGVLVDDDRIIDLCAADPGLPGSVREILAEDLLPRVEEIVSSYSETPMETLVSSRDVRLGPPIIGPSKIICVGRNYREHATEQGLEPPDFPMLFSKGPNALCGHSDAVPYPGEVEQLDFEAELAFVIGRRGVRILQKNAWDHVAGYCVFIDLTARDLQQREKQWFRGKSFDGAGPCGPCLVTRDEIADPHKLAISLQVNDETLQSASTGDMIFTIDYLVHHISKTMTLEPGDIIATGTPPGVGAHRKPPRFLQRSDRITATVESIGSLACTIA